MKRFEASGEIAASPETLWAILMDGAGYAEWDPHCERIEGRIADGQKIKAFTTLSPGRAFPVKVAVLEAGRRMTWSGGMPLGLFKGERTFLIEPLGEERTRFTVSEVFSGPMLRVIGRTIPDMTGPFQDFVAGLKARAEGQA